MNKNKKRIVVVAVVAALIAIMAAGTIAYFTDTTDKASNTFTVGKVDIELTEVSEAHDDYVPGVAKEDGSMGFDYNNVSPGTKYAKAPVITVDKDSLEAYVYAEFIVTNYNDLYAALEADNLPADQLDSMLLNKYSYITSGNVADYWTENDSEFHIVYYIGTYTGQDPEIQIQLFDGVQVPAGLTSTGLELISGKDIDFNVKGYAIQTANVPSWPEGWAVLSPKPAEEP